MNATHHAWTRIRRFLNHDLWELEAVGQSRLKRFVLHQSQICVLVVRDFVADRCLLKASALTFTTLLSIVPLLALMFSVLKGFGVQNVLEPLLLQQLAVGSSDAVNKLIEYINNTNVARLGIFGLIFLIIAVLTLLSNIEDSFNSVWGVVETRPLLRRFTDYFSVVTIGPVFVVAAISMTSSLQSQGLVQNLLGKAYVGEVFLLLFKVLPFMVMWLVFAGLYLFMPNIKVSPKAALIGGIFGGTLWQISQWLYVNFQIGVAKYNAIYGTMAALPIFMVWIYLSWMIVLLGLEMTYATQNLRSIRQDIRGSRVNFASRELVALTVLVFVGSRFRQGLKAPTQETIAEHLEVPPRLLRCVIDELQRLELVVEVNHDTGDNGYQPAMALDRTKVCDVLRGLEIDGDNYSRLSGTNEHDVIADLVTKRRAAEEQALDGLTLHDLVVQAESLTLAQNSSVLAPE
ncbi:MAG: YihY family inner membrane protein [Deltaproteobacteria bacterium]|jgi:membrane protein|nr:YihY family inner membrane protein [Deltaproteobacteria bacterium]MBW2504456.1 YihY family inner membrane protein [Deltaproteobacteria bacterium]MBW2518971.1 YihY family inner membrane protein [Deltaproteobacteria bacterium]